LVLLGALALLRAAKLQSARGDDAQESQNFNRT
jgi:hypothetical protein